MLRAYLVVRMKMLRCRNAGASSFFWNLNALSAVATRVWLAVPRSCATVKYPHA